MEPDGVLERIEYLIAHGNIDEARKESLALRDYLEDNGGAPTWHDWPVASSFYHTV